MAYGDLVAALRRARSEAPDGDIVVRIHLFGIEHANDLVGIDLKALARAADAPVSYATEIRKGMRLADHVARR